MFPLSELIPTHNRLRNKDSFNFFYDKFYYAEYPEIDDFDFNYRYDKVQIVKTEDGKHYLWNAHHRCAAAFKRGIRYIQTESYNITEMSYEKVMTVNLDKGFVTPFDMRTECRLPDFSGYKSQIINLYNDGRLCQDRLQKTAFLYEYLFKEPRKIYSIGELVK